MFSRITYFLFFVTITLAAQTNFSEFVKQLNKTADVKKKQLIIEDFLRSKKEIGIPIIENETVHFIYFGAADTVAIAGDFNDWKLVHQY